MKMDLGKPFELRLERFNLDARKDSVNPYMTGKLVRKKYDDAGYKVLQAGDFETNLLVEFVKHHKFFDKYIKVKLGQYRKDVRIENYNKEILSVLDFRDIEKLLFICRICSYLGDPSFPDFIISKDGKAELRYIYTGDEILRNRVIFIFLLKCLSELEIKFCGLDFSDFKGPEKLAFDIGRGLEEGIELISSRVNIEKSFDETGIDLGILKSWVEKKTAEGDELGKAYNQFTAKAQGENKIRELVSKLDGMDVPAILDDKTKPEKLAALRQALGINMLEANDVLNLYEIIRESKTAGQ